MEKSYWNFYWPLALTGVTFLLARQFQNGALARYPDAAHELATYAFAFSVFMLCDAALLFLPQLANALVRGAAARRVCFRFMLFFCVVMTIPLAFLAFVPVGGTIIELMFNVTGSTREQVVFYLRLMSPLVFVNGFRHFYTGLLVQCRRTGVVTILNGIYFMIVVAILIGGSMLRWNAVWTLAGGLVCAGLIHLALTFGAYIRFYRAQETVKGPPLGYGEIFSYFWPMALTSMMFSFSQPILYSFVNRVENGTVIVAALRVAFDFVLIFHNPLNQFRHLFVTFGRADIAEVRRFMVKMTVAAVALMMILSLPWFSAFWLRDLLGVRGDIMAMTQQITWVLCLLPAAVSLRNYFHGKAMIARRTRSMGAGSIVRNGALYGVAWVLLTTGLLNHITAALALVAGFFAETAVVAWADNRRGVTVGTEEVPDAI